MTDDNAVWSYTGAGGPRAALAVPSLHSSALRTGADGTSMFQRHLSPASCGLSWHTHAVQRCGLPAPV
ncbi:hypothetical protein QMZ30_17705 [Pantoea sp. EA-12]|uniref:hypothetical protein n=1 Tax=Pantoea sp. EA-12 TaxID=3043303 RepID=UPI0024B61AC5|nr:hypothetical protein [Pantoea sp. EA-12]MDI9222744.1 hypothetical protein [Pantoea sp. EA-12]